MRLVSRIPTRSCSSLPRAKACAVRSIPSAKPIAAPKASNFSPSAKRATRCFPWPRSSNLTKNSKLRKPPRLVRISKILRQSMAPPRQRLPRTSHPPRQPMLPPSRKLLPMKTIKPKPNRKSRPSLHCKFSKPSLHRLGFFFLRSPHRLPLQFSPRMAPPCSLRSSSILMA